MKILNVPSPHFNERLFPIDSIILHYTNLPSVKETLTWLLNPLSQVSAHYLVDEEGQIYQMVAEEKRAWHAGESYWQGCTDMNSCSLGIELANPGQSHGYQPFPEAQIEALIRLCQRLKTQWDIAPSRILGHSDIAPRRKQDPGHLFPWHHLAQEELGLWPYKTGAVIEGNLMKKLAHIGYEIVSPLHTILAFQQHFQPHKVDGIPDQETDALVQGML
jgi:N-acetylmuramoyl-L-alanine amidase